ncbi:MAG: 4Fe-4S binding protein [Syntrophales bacterium]
MSDEIYYKLAKVLDTLPSGFPPTESSVEIRLLKKIFTPEQAELFCEMRLAFETAEQVAERTGRPLEGLEKMLKSMAEAGQLFSIPLGDKQYFKMLPWIFGIFEFQIGRIDKELAELAEEFGPAFFKQFYDITPQLMQVLPVEEEILIQQRALPYERVSTLIEHGQSFLANDCICKIERGLVGKPCDRSVQVCLAIAPIPGIFDNSPRGRILTREEAYELLRRSEEEGFVHLTSNLQHGHIYICNCCKCCCGVLRSINELHIPASKVINSHYYAEIDPDECIGCGTCSDDRCQVNAIEEGEDVYRIVKEKCIGCGLCINTCPSRAIRLVHKSEEQIITPPITEDTWLDERGRNRGVDFSRFK